MLIMKKIQTYQGVDAGNYSIQDKIEEYFIVRMTDAVIYPNAMMILTTKRQQIIIITKILDKP